MKSASSHMAGKPEGIEIKREPAEEDAGTGLPGMPAAEDPLKWLQSKNARTELRQAQDETLQCKQFMEAARSMKYSEAFIADCNSQSRRLATCAGLWEKIAYKGSDSVDASKQVKKNKPNKSKHANQNVKTSRKQVKRSNKF